MSYKKLILGGIFLLFFSLGIALLFVPTPSSFYQIEKKATHEVVVKPSIFYKQKTVTFSAYPARLIQQLNLNFNYRLKGSNAYSISYCDWIEIEYSLFFQEGNQKEEIWKKRENFIQKENKKFTGNHLVIQKTIQIPYSDYVSLVQEYEATYKIAVESLLKVRLHVSFSNQKSDTIELEIPITQTITTIKENYSKEETKEIKEPRSVTKWTLGITFILLSIALLFDWYLHYYKKKDFYLLRKKKLLKEYRELIVTTLNEPDIFHLKPLYLSRFEDLIDIAEQNSKHIIHYEKKETKQDQFYIILFDYVYLFVMEKGKKGY